MSQFAYSRPRLVRNNSEYRNGQWNFACDDIGAFSGSQSVTDWSCPIEVPLAPEAAASGINDCGFRPICWHRREFDADADEGALLLHFGAVDYSATVGVNDVLAMRHEGGPTPFFADITHALRGDEPQVLVQRADDDPADLAKPRGKQHWQLEPHSIWYPRTSGVWQTAWLERVASTHIKAVRWTPVDDNVEIGCQVQAAGPLKSGLSVEVKLSHRETLLADGLYARGTCNWPYSSPAPPAPAAAVSASPFLGYRQSGL